MHSGVGLLVVSLVLSSLTLGCATKATGEDCQNACANVARIAVREVDAAFESDQELSQAGDEGRQIAQRMAEAMAQAIAGECEEACNKKGRREKAQCLASAKTMVDLEACNR